MLNLDLNGKRLTLRGGTELAMEVLNPLLNDGIEDSHSMPLELPAEGNEVELGHVHQLALKERTLELPGLRAGHNGVPIHSGVLRVLGSNDETIRGTLSAEAFVVELGDTTLKEALADQVIDAVAESGDVGAHVKNVNGLVADMTPGADDTGWSHYFPLYHNPGLYGNENADWNRSASEFDYTQTYAVDDLVTFYEPTPARRGWTWQCILGTSAGQTPLTHPSHWQRVVFGMVNRVNGSSFPYENDGSGNFYALVPWFRLRWLVLKTLDYFGLVPAGDAFLEGGALSDKSMYTLGNNTPLDDEGRSDYFQASQDTPVDYPGSAGDGILIAKVPADDDSGGTNTDPTDVWDPTTNEFIPSAAGTWVFRIQLTLSPPLPPNPNTAGLTWPRTRLFLRKSADDSLYLGGVEGVWSSADVGGSYTAEVALNFVSGDVGQRFYFNVTQVGSFTLDRPPIAGGPVTVLVPAWPVQPGHTYERVVIRGWLRAGAAVNAFRSLIEVADHVPDWTAAEFLDHVADAFNLEVVPDMEKRTVHFNHRLTVLRNQAKNTSDQSARLLGAVELDHGRATTGLVYDWGMEAGDVPDLTNLQRVADVNVETELAPPLAAGQYCVVRSTRKVLTSLYKGLDGLVWQPAGYDVGKALEGVEKGARTIDPGFVPVHMEEVRMADDRWVVPTMDEAGASTFFGTTSKGGKAWLSIANGYTTSESGTLYASANSWGRAYSMEAPQPQSLHLALDTLDPDDVPNHWSLYHHLWWRLLVTAEPVTMDLEVDPNYLRGTAWRRFQQMQGQLYLVEKLPMVYGEQPGPLVCEGAYALRVRVPLPLPLPVAEAEEVFDDGGLDNIVFRTAVRSDGRILVGGSFTLYGATTANRFTLMNSDGTLNTAFNTNMGTGADGTVKDFALDSAGRTIIVGSFANVNGVARAKIARINTNGTLDTTFDPGSGFNGSLVNSVAILADGTIVVVGDFTSYDGTARNRITGINPDGSISTAFAVGSGFNSAAELIALCPDGTVIVSSRFFSVYNGTSVRHVSATATIVRINTDGTYNATVAAGTQFDASIRGLAVQPNGKIIVTGEFTTYNGTTVGRIVRIDAAGGLDGAFLAAGGAGFNDWTTSALVLASGKIVVGIYTVASTTYDGTNVAGLARLLSNGTLDTTFNTGAGFNGATYSMARSGTDVIVAGGFTTVDGVSQKRLTRMAG